MVDMLTYFLSVPSLYVITPYELRDLLTSSPLLICSVGTWYCLMGRVTLADHLPFFLVQNVRDDAIYAAQYLLTSSPYLFSWYMILPYELRDVC